MQVLNSDLVKNKKVLLRYDIDVALGKGTGNRLQVTEDFKLKAGIPTLKLCLENASKVVIIGHLGRPEGKIVEELRVAPIKNWLSEQDNLSSHMLSSPRSTRVEAGGKLVVLENLRFDPREEALDKEYAKELANLGDVYINEAFSSHHPAVSTTILPTLLPHAAGLRFAEEVRVLGEVRENPKKPFIAIMGGAKVEDKLSVIKVLAQKADAVLVGGKLVHEIREQNLQLPANVMVGKLSDDGFDISPDTTQSWRNLIMGAKMVVWNGPLGKVDSEQWTVDSPGTAKGTYDISKIILESSADTVVGGGDTIAFLGEAGLLEKFQNKGFVSVGGGAMLKLLSDGTLPTIEALG